MVISFDFSLFFMCATISCTISSRAWLNYSRVFGIIKAQKGAKEYFLMSLGNKIYELRTAKNMSQIELAEQLEVSRQAVSKWETDAATPDLDKLIKLCNLFEVSLDQITEREALSQSTIEKTNRNLKVLLHKK